MQLADAVWQVIFENLPTEAATYLQKEFFAQSSVEDLKRVFKTIKAPARGAQKLWLPSFWSGVFGTCPGAGGGTNPLEARHGSWEAELQSRTKDGLVSAVGQDLRLGQGHENDACPQRRERLPAEQWVASVAGTLSCGGLLGKAE